MKSKEALVDGAYREGPQSHRSSNIIRLTFLKDHFGGSDRKDPEWDQRPGDPLGIHPSPGGSG